MKSLASFTAAVLLGAAPFAVAQVNMPNPGSPGMSPQSAVRLLATSDLMVDRQIKRWIRQHYPGWTADPHEFMELGPERYAVVYISAPNQSGRRLYFRVQRSPMEDDQSFPEF
jgi:hypothetical protein